MNWMKNGTSKTHITIITAIVTAVITATITVGIPEIVKAVKPAETINVVLQDLREKEPEEFNHYIETTLQKNDQIIMNKVEDTLTFNNNSLDYYTLGMDKYISVSELISASSGMITLSENGKLNIFADTTEMGDGLPVAGKDWMEECPPYELGDFSIVLESNGDEVHIGGVTYLNGLLSTPVWQSQALFNLQGKYQTLTFSAGHVDKSAMYDCTYNFYIDGKKVKTITLKADQLLEEFEIPLNNGQQLKIENMDTRSYTKFAFVNGYYS